MYYRSPEYSLPVILIRLSLFEYIAHLETLEIVLVSRSSKPSVSDALSQMGIWHTVPTPILLILYDEAADRDREVSASPKNIRVF